MYLIIGGSSDLGYRVAKSLVNFDNVIITYNSNLKKKIRTKKNKIIYEKLDLTSYNDIKVFVRKYENKLKKINLLNFAALSIDKLAHQVSPEDIEKVFRINTISNILLSKYLIPIMVKENYGRLIFFTSTRATRGDVGISLYSASKTALNGFTKSIAKEYSRFNITTNCLRLGYFNSKLFNNINKKLSNKLIKNIPSKKLGNTDHIVNMILAIEKSSYVNGAEIPLDDCV